MKRLGGDPKKINPLVPVDLVIDHSVQVDHFGTPDSLDRERRPGIPAQPRALRVPALGPEGASTISASCRRRVGIVHQVNLEYLAKVRLPARGRRRAGRLARHAGRHRQPHHDDQRPGRASAGAWAASRPRR